MGISAPRLLRRRFEATPMETEGGFMVSPKSNGMASGSRWGHFRRHDLDSQRARTHREIIGRRGLTGRAEHASHYRRANACDALHQLPLNKNAQNKVWMSRWIGLLPSAEIFARTFASNQTMHIDFPLANDKEERGTS